MVERFKQKFLKEAGLIASFDNANIIRIYDVFEENGTAYYVMEYLEGKSLKALVDESGALPEAIAVKYIRQIAEALKEVHENNLLHLDVKPANIMLDKKGNAVLIDFGISKHYDEAGHQTSSAGVGISEGYAPIEQYEAGALKTFTPVTDIYALGATLFFLLTGTRPPKASEVMNVGLPALPGNVSPAVRNAIETAMQPATAKRPQSIKEFIELVESGEMKDESGKMKDATCIFGNASSDGSSAASQNVMPLGSQKASVAKEQESIFGNASSDGSSAASQNVMPLGSQKASVAKDESEETKIESDVTNLSMGTGKNASTGNAAADEQEDIAVEVVETPSVAPEPAPRPQAEENQKKNKFLWIIILLAVIFGALGGFMLFGGGGNVNPNANNTAVAKNAELIIEGAPDSANVYVDGSFIGKTPLERKTVPLGEHTIKIEKECYETYEQQHAFNNPNTPVTVKATLEFATHTFSANGVEFTMVAVEGGTFSMGSNDGESNEKPIHQVTLDSYFIGQTEVTQALWQAVRGGNPSYFKGTSNPVETVNYNDCIDFVNKLNTLLKDQLPHGRKFRLPTEAEWEYAARGGNKSKGYEYSGSNSIGTVAWYDGNSGRKTHPVKQKASNELGLYDMSGNVQEWCSDYYSSNYYSSSPQNNPKGPGSGSHRVLRGASWCHLEQCCRSADRACTGSGYRYNYYGLRLAF